MQQRKLSPLEADTSELLDALNQESKPNENLDYSSDQMMEYFNFFGIKPGKYKVSSKVLFAIYCNWKEDRKKRFNYNLFTSNLAQYIPQIKTNKGTFFKISQNTFKLSEEAIKQLQEDTEVKKSKANRVHLRAEHYKQFISWLGLAKGKTAMRINVLLYFYDYWTYNFKKRDLGLARLVEFLVYRRFAYRRTAYERFILIDKNKLTVTQEELQKAQEWAEKYAQRESNKTKSSSKKEINNDSQEKEKN